MCFIRQNNNFFGLVQDWELTLVSTFLKLLNHRCDDV